MTVNEYLESTFDRADKYQTREKIVCKDGFSVSVQGGTEFHYCTPRYHINVYGLVELGFPSSNVPELKEWKEGGDEVEDTGTVFGYVPIEEVEALVERHGGIVNL